MLYNYCCKNCGCNNQAQIELNEGIEVLCKNCKHYFETYFEHLNGGGVFIRLKELVGKKIIKELEMEECMNGIVILFRGEVPMPEITVNFSVASQGKLLEENLFKIEREKLNKILNEQVEKFTHGLSLNLLRAVKEYKDAELRFNQAMGE